MGKRGNLSLTRKVGESCVINGDIVVTVKMAYGGKARIQIVADKSVKIMRSELLPHTKGESS